MSRCTDKLPHRCASYAAHCAGGLSYSYSSYSYGQHAAVGTSRWLATNCKATCGLCETVSPPLPPPPPPPPIECIDDFPIWCKKNAASACADNDARLTCRATCHACALPPPPPRPPNRLPPPSPSDLSWHRMSDNRVGMGGTASHSVGDHSPTSSSEAATTTAATRIVHDYKRDRSSTEWKWIAALRTARDHPTTPSSSNGSTSRSGSRLVGGVVGGLVGAALGSAAAGTISDVVGVVVAGGALGLATGGVVGAAVVPSDPSLPPLPPIIGDVLPIETIAAAFPDQFYHPHSGAAWGWIVSYHVFVFVAASLLLLLGACHSAERDVNIREAIAQQEAQESMADALARSLRRQEEQQIAINERRIATSKMCDEEFGAILARATTAAATAASAVASSAVVPANAAAAAAALRGKPRRKQGRKAERAGLMSVMMSEEDAWEEDDASSTLFDDTFGQHQVSGPSAGELGAAAAAVRRASGLVLEPTQQQRRRRRRQQEEEEVRRHDSAAAAMRSLLHITPRAETPDDGEEATEETATEPEEAAGEATETAVQPVEPMAPSNWNQLEPMVPTMEMPTDSPVGLLEVGHEIGHEASFEAGSMNDLIEAGLRLAAPSSPSSVPPSLALLKGLDEPATQPSPDVTTPTVEAAPVQSADTTPAWLVEAESMILAIDGPSPVDTPPVESDLVDAAPETVFRA